MLAVAICRLNAKLLACLGFASTTITNVCHYYFLEAVPS